MTPSMIEKAQICLSVNNNGRVHKIIDIENLLHKHNTELVLQLLRSLFAEYQQMLKRLVINDKSSAEIDETVSKMFRIYMAIRVIEEDIQEVIAA